MAKLTQLGWQGVAMTTAKDVAGYIVKKFQDRGDLITNLKIQKLLYYVQGWHLGLHKERAFDGEFRAWIHGPVNLDVYHEYKRYRWTPISDEQLDVDLPKDLQEHVDEVLSVYGGDTAWALEHSTHLERPWLTARAGLNPDDEGHAVIRDEIMQEFFEEQAKDDGGDQEG
ncbi:Panacea domain-containing protein [Rhodanobacter sp. FW102-FHT14D06]|uniref:Panacea domain-containing protein n=2 Tax=unclassified Rhodanobacter TaxID=2621553 RepID=A0AB74UV38_9GAMM